MKYETTVTIKLSVDQKNKLNDYAAKRSTDSSVILREFVDGIDKDREQILKDIDFHNYEILRLNKLLIKMDDEVAKEERVQACMQETATQMAKSQAMVNELFKKAVQHFGAGLKFKTDVDKQQKKEEVDKFIIDVTAGQVDQAGIVFELKKKAYKYILSYSAQEYDKEIGKIK